MTMRRQSGRLDDSDVLAPEAVRRAVDRVVASPTFAGSDRLSRFLRYVVEQALADNRDAIKEYTIGVEVYGRPVDYDPKIDAIVRVEAGRLRSKLAKYYRTEGAEEPLIIELPKGTYIPVLTVTGTGGSVRNVVPKRHGRSRLRAATAAAVLGVVAIVSIWLIMRSVRAPRPIVSLAILPFTTAKGDVAAEHFAVGLVQRLMSAASGEGGFVVANRVESDRFNSSSRDIAAMRKELGIGIALDGSVESVGDGMRTTVHLLGAERGFDLWSQTYESRPGGIGKFAEDVSNLIARTLRARFAGLNEGELGKPPTRNAEAMAYYLKGHEAWLTQRRKGLVESLEYYRRALDKDRNFAKAYEGIAASELFLANFDVANANEHVRRAKSAALKAIELDDRLDDAHARLGNIYLRREWNFAGAEHELRRSVILAPGSSPITRWYSEAARLRENNMAAREELNSALLANPNSEMLETELGMLDYQMARFAEAEADMRRSAKVDPSYRPNHVLAGFLDEHNGRLSDAETEYVSCSNMSEFGQLCMAALGHLCGQLGRKEKAHDILRQLDAANPPVPSLSALIYVGLNDYESAFAALEQAFQKHDMNLPLVKLDSRFRPLHGDPRYSRMIERLGLVPPVQ